MRKDGMARAARVDWRRFCGGQAADSEPEEGTVRQHGRAHMRKDGVARAGGAPEGRVFGGFQGGRRRFRNRKVKR